jgi:hypothetical protein
MMDNEIIERWEDLVRAYEERERKALRLAWLKGWAEMMHEAPNDKFFGTGVWFGAKFPIMIFVIPWRE